MHRPKTPDPELSLQAPPAPGTAGNAGNGRQRALPRTWLCLCAVILLSLSGCQLADIARFNYANANATPHWANAGCSTTVPFTLVDNHIILPVRVGGSQPLNFVLDSGAAASVIIDSRASRALHLKMGGKLPVSGVGTGPDPTAYIVPDTLLSIGDLSLDGLWLVYLPLDAIPFFDDLDQVYFDGVIGASFFTRFVVDIDYDRKLITLTEPSAATERLARPGQDWREIPLQIESGVPYLTAHLDQEGHSPVEVKLLVDTGFRGAASLTAATHGGIVEPGDYFENVNQGLSGDVTSRVSLAKSLGLADYPFPGLPINYDAAGGESENDSNGILGNEVLQQFNLVFDYPNERMFITPNTRFGTAINADRSGLDIQPHVEGAIVKRIAASSGGEASGLQVGDIITTVDATPVTYRSIGALKRTLASERDTVHLCWLSDAAPHCDDLPLASRFSAF